MKISVVSIYFTIWFLNSKRALCQIQNQGSVLEDTRAVSAGLSKFAIELLHETASEGGDNINVIMSTYSVWNLLAMLNEGAAGATSYQLTSALRIPFNNNVFRVGYKSINSALTVNTPGVDISTASAIFTDQNKQLLKNFQTSVQSQYNAKIFPVNFQDAIRTAQLVDNYIARETNNRIKHFINYDDLKNAQLLLTTAIYFKGDWSTPFNSTATHDAQFFDENNKYLGNVSMMYESAPFPYTLLQDLQANAVELPYGTDKKYSMIVILPQLGVKLSNLLQRLIEVPFQNIIDLLERETEEYEGENTVVYLPKFKITSDFVLNVVLEKMKINDVFDPYYANLMKISNENLFLSRVIHKAEIEVNERGTIASGATGGTIDYRQPPPVFMANRPFAFFIIEKSTSTVLFAGKISNPNDL